MQEQTSQEATSRVSAGLPYEASLADGAAVRSGNAARCIEAVNAVIVSSIRPADPEVARGATRPSNHA